jgi:serine phosphatase RsbU (regulator of sigma subunit)/PAS domain-containing protein
MSISDPPNATAERPTPEIGFTYPFTRIRPGSGFVPALALLLALLAFDIATWGSVVIAGMYAIVPFLTAIRGETRATVLLGVMSVSAAAASGIWNENFGSLGYTSRLVLVVVAAVIARYAAVSIERNATVARQLRLLNEVTAASERGALGDVLAMIGNVAVPEIADICLIDVVADGRVKRVTASVAGPRTEELEPALLSREPSIPEQVVFPSSEGDEQPFLKAQVDDEDLKSMAHSPEDLELLRSIGLRSFVSVPLISGGSRFGALTLVQAWSGRRQEAHDAQFARALAGRAALALDNAGLFSDLQSIERRMDVVMDVVDEAVTVNDVEGELIFANRAAVELIGCDSLEELLDLARSGEQRFQIYAESGRPLPAEGPLATGLASGSDPVIRLVRGDGDQVWLRVRSRDVSGEDGRTLFRVSVFGDVTDLKAEEFAQAVRAAVSELLLDASTNDEIMAGLASTVVPLLADACAVFVPGDEGVYNLASLANGYAERAPELEEAIAAHPLREDEEGLERRLGVGEPFVFSDLRFTLGLDVIGEERRARLAELGVRSLMVVPLRAGPKLVGVMVLANYLERLALGQSDREIALAVAERIALSVENARVVAERNEIAETLQAGLISPPVPDIPGWSLAASYRPAGSENRVGGDFYDFFRIEDGWMAVIGDVTGHGARAATVTALARYTLRTAGSMTGDPEAALMQLNRSLLNRPGRELCTMVLLTIRNEAGGRIEVTVAGHPPPFLLAEAVALPVERRGPILGAFEDSSWESTALDLEVGEGLVLYTDGLIEARRGDDRFGLGRVSSTVEGCRDPAIAVARLDAAMREFAGDHVEDDTALVAVVRAEGLPMSGAGSGNG